jgi:hypothetical protein
MGYADDIRRKSEEAKGRLPMPPLPPPPETWIEMQMRLIRSSISRAADAGDNHVSYILFGTSDAQGVGWRAYFKPLPIIVSIIDDFFPLTYRTRHFADPANLRGDARKIYDVLRSEGFEVTVKNGSFNISW